MNFRSISISRSGQAAIGGELTVILIAFVVVDTEFGKDAEQSLGDGAEFGQLRVEHAEMQGSFTDTAALVETPTREVFRDDVTTRVIDVGYLGIAISSSNNNSSLSSRPFII